MKRVVQIETARGVVDRDDKKATSREQEQTVGFEQVMKALEHRAHCFGPVVEAILRLDHEINPWTSHE